MEWVECIRRSGAPRAWLYFNNDNDGYAVKNAREMEKLLKGARCSRVR